MRRRTESRDERGRGPARNDCDTRGGRRRHRADNPGSTGEAERGQSSHARGSRRTVAKWLRTRSTTKVVIVQSEGRRVLRRVRPRRSQRGRPRAAGGLGRGRARDGRSRRRHARDHGRIDPRSLHRRRRGARRGRGICESRPRTPRSASPRSTSASRCSGPVSRASAREIGPALTKEVVLTGRTFSAARSARRSGSSTGWSRTTPASGDRRPRGEIGRQGHACRAYHQAAGGGGGPGRPGRRRRHRRRYGRSRRSVRRPRGPRGCGSLPPAIMMALVLIVMR